MMKTTTILCLMLLLGGTASLKAQDSNAADTVSVAETQRAGSLRPDKSVADEAYAAGRYDEAAGLYEQILAEQGISPVLYYNLGNSYFKQDQLGRAILNYERSLLLSPGDADTRFNLELARSRTIDKITPLGELFFITWARDFANLQSADAWARTAIACFILCLLSLGLYLFGRRQALRRVSFFAALILVVMCVVSHSASSYRHSLLVERTQAIVMQPSVTVKSTPDQSGTDLFVLHEGCKVEIKDDSMRSWKEIRLADGNVGWIPVEAIEVI